MVIFHKNGSIFDAPVEALVNPVNCIGVMGSGLAKEFRKRFPKPSLVYKDICYTGGLHVGNMLVIRDIPTNKQIIHFPTKVHWRQKSRIEYIQDGLYALACVINTYYIESVAIPALGCGLGGLSWDSVKEHILTMTQKNPDVIYHIYEPQ